MSSYPILDNRPIDQWKVTELKEELKRRKLTTKGLKDDLIKRLHEAIRVERENELDNGVDSDPQAEAEVKDSETVSVVSGGAVGEGAANDVKIDDARVQVDVTKNSSTFNEATVEGVETAVGSDVGRADEGPVAAPYNVEASIEITEAVVASTTVTETVVTETVSPNSAEPVTTVTGEAVSPNTAEMKPSVTESLVKEQALMELDLEKPVIQDGDADGTLKTQVENEDMKPPHEDVILASAALGNQVSEVSPTLGNPVKSDSISTDSVSINEKNEFKDNIIADNIKLELDVTKPEMVEPSSSHVVPESGDSHPMDVEEPHGIKLAVKDENDGNAPDEDLNKNNETADVGYSEKLNLDRSSGDDSMDEDVPENKDADSGHRVEKIGDKDEKIDVTMVKEEITVDITGGVDEKDIKIEKDHSSVLAEKRKLRDQGSNENSEPLKRHCKWKSENIKVPEPQNSSVTPTTTPGGSAQTTAFKRNFSRSDSTATDDTPKERIVPPSQKTPTNSLRIDRFLRPFTLKAVQELLGKTGMITSFWMDHIKTHCYVSYSSVEEAIETRNAVYNLQWPPNGGRLLVADFVEPQEVKMRLENPPQTSAPTLTAPVTNAAPATQAAAKPPPSPRQQMPKQQLPPPPPVPAVPPTSHPPRERERLPLPPPPPLPEKADSTIVTLDVLFRKTKATPRIYYLPLSEDQVAAKLAARGRATRQ